MQKKCGQTQKFRALVWLLILIGAAFLGTTLWYFASGSGATNSNIIGLENPRDEKKAKLTENSKNIRDKDSWEREEKSPLALDALARIPVKPAANTPHYHRDAFGPAWADIEQNGCSTREDILRRDLENWEAKKAVNASFKNPLCPVVSGILKDPYTGKTIAFTRGRDSGKVQIDHVVALGNAWRTGAKDFTDQARLAFANDPINLIAVESRANELKSDSDAAGWLPSNKTFCCEYAARQIAIKVRWHLWVTKAEKASIAKVLKACPGQILAQTHIPTALLVKDAQIYLAKTRTPGPKGVDKSG